MHDTLPIRPKILYSQFMKTATDPRHKKRISQVQYLFAADFQRRPLPAISHIWKKLAKIDPIISQAAPEWPLDKLNRIDLAILRLAVYELTVDKKEPFKVIIDEAIELAKQFGSDNAPEFVNGVLGFIVNQNETPKSHS